MFFGHHVVAWGEIVIGSRTGRVSGAFTCVYINNV